MSRQGEIDFMKIAVPAGKDSLFLAIVPPSPSQFLAQDTGALITGTVHDSSGAVVPGATVKITSAAGGNDRTLTTNSDGDYLAAGLPGGNYDITVSAAGFKTFKAKGVALRVAQKARVDATLTRGPDCH